MEQGITRNRTRSISITWLIITIVTLLIGGSYAIAAYRASVRIKQIDWLAGLPAADSGSAVNSPARFAGKLYGPKDRRTPLGQKAAAYWWMVTSENGGDDTGEFIDCESIVRSDLVLVTPEGTMPIAWSGADPEDVSLASDSDSGEYGLPFAIDIGPTPAMVYNEVPPGICSSGETYTQLHLDQGVSAEVAGCVENGLIGRCDAVVGGVISVPGIESDMRHRLQSAMHSFFFPMYLGLALMILSTTVLVRLARAGTAFSGEEK